MRATVKPLPCPVCGCRPLVKHGVVKCIHGEKYYAKIPHTLQTFRTHSNDTAKEQWNAIVNATRATTTQKQNEENNNDQTENI